MGLSTFVRGTIDKGDVFWYHGNRKAGEGERMLNTYWSLLALGLFGAIFSLALFAVLLVLTRKKKIRHTYFWTATVFLLLALVLSISILIPCAKDYPMVLTGECVEDEATVMVFTHVREDPDGNGQTQYSQPKFYLENKQEYIVLYVSGVEVGKTYKIRYLPNTRICEVVESVE